MTIQELAKLVGQMRAAQIEYFRTRSTQALEHSKAMERQVDKACLAALSETQQRSMFDG